jgi:hypothetical protein
MKKSVIQRCLSLTGIYYKNILQFLVSNAKLDINYLSIKSPTNVIKTRKTAKITQPAAWQASLYNYIIVGFNIIKIRQSVLDLQPFVDFQYGGRRHL